MGNGHEANTLKPRADRRLRRYHDVKSTLVHGVYHGGAMIECPGVVVHTGPGATYLGADDNSDLITSEFLTHVADLLSRAGLSTQVRNDVDPIVWQKIAVNAALNTLTTILRCVCLSVTRFFLSCLMLLREWRLCSRCQNLGFVSRLVCMV